MKRQSGYGMLELLLVICGVLVLVGLGIGWYVRSTENTRAAKLIETVTAVDQTIRTRYGNQYTFEGLSLQAINDDLPAHIRACPEGGCGTDLQVLTPWGGTLTVAANDPPTAFSLVLEGSMSKGGCVDLLIRAGGHFSTIQVHRRTIKDGSLSAITVDQAVSACSSARMGPSNNQDIPMVLVGS